MGKKKVEEKQKRRKEQRKKNGHMGQWGEKYRKRKIIECQTESYRYYNFFYLFCLVGLFLEFSQLITV